MRISDWSSDVCSSDLPRVACPACGCSCGLWPVEPQSASNPRKAGGTPHGHDHDAAFARNRTAVCPPAESRRLQALHDEMKDIAARNDPAAFADANHALHSMVYKGAPKIGRAHV